MFCVFRHWSFCQNQETSVTTEDPLTSFSVSTVLTFFLFTLYMFDSSSWLQNLCVTKESSTRLTKSDKVKLQRLMAGVLRNTDCWSRRADGSPPVIISHQTDDTTTETNRVFHITAGTCVFPHPRNQRITHCTTHWMKTLQASDWSTASIVSSSELWCRNSSSPRPLIKTVCVLV